MKKLCTTILACLASVCMMAQGWPANYGGVMLQGFYWDYYNDSDEMNSTGWATWNGLASHATELEGYIDLIWIPNSARTKNDYCVEHAATEGNKWLKDMGYMPCWWLNHDNTIFGDSDDLKAMIAAYKAKGIGIIEDVVINHKNGENDWCDFPYESVTVGGKTYELNWSLNDICYNDNGGYVRTMFDVTGAADTGDDFDGCRDLDHTGANVQQNVKTYLDYLQKELGYSGFRYDMVKGYNPQYVGIYNTYAKPTFSVGECWDNIDGTTWWVNGTKQDDVVQSAAFDFPLKFLINSAFKNGFDGGYLSMSNLNDLSLAGKDAYKRYSITFVDNHDTYREESIPMSNANHVLAANAFILAMPGTPCIFLPHWKQYKESLKKMIAARKAAGVTNQSTVESVDGLSGGIGYKVTGTNGSILITLGYVTAGVPSGYKVVVAGDETNKDFCFYVNNDISDETLAARPASSNASLGNARVDMASGYYYQTVTVNVSPSDDFTTLVYTEDGSDPTVSSNTIGASGQAFVYNTVGTHTLKVGVKGASEVTNIQTYNYTITNTEPTDITIYVRADKEPLYLYAWDTNGTLTSDWPGTQLSEMKSIDGDNFYYMTFPKPTEGYMLNYILNQGSDATKTPDQTGISSDVFTALGNGTAEDLSSYQGKTISDPIETDPITVYVKGDFGPAYIYTWGGYNNGTWPGTKMSTTLINGQTWFYYTMPKNVTSFNMKVSEGNNMPQSNDYAETVSSTVYLQWNKTSGNLEIVNGMSEYPVEPWYEQGEICAFFVDDGWSSHKIYAYVYNGSTEYEGGWPGADDCTCLGFNEDGGKIWKWNYDGASLPESTIIIFNNNGSDQTANCIFTNGGWYNTSNTGTNTAAVSTAVEPSSEINVTALGNSVTATNWNGKSEKVAVNNGANPMEKSFNLAAGSYVIQAIVRGTSGKAVTLSVSAKEGNASVDLKGMDKGMDSDSESTVQTSGVVEKFDKGENNGWRKVELPFTLDAAEKVTVTLTSEATTWQLGALELVAGTTAKTKATTGTDLATNSYIDTRGESGFSFYERGENRNALIKAAAGTLPAQLPYNVIVNGNCKNLKLTDGNYSFKNAGEAFTAKNVSYDREFKYANETSTICLPFEITSSDDARDFGTFWRLDSYDLSKGTVNFVEVDFGNDEKVEANTPYLFEKKSDGKLPDFSDKTIPTTSSLTVTKDDISFIGVNEGQEIRSDYEYTYYGFAKDKTTDKNAFVKIGQGGVHIKPFRAYLRVPTSQASPTRMYVSFDGEVSGIHEVTADEGSMDNQNIYNLSGQRVQAPDKKGLYIVSGKKYVVK